MSSRLDTGGCAALLEGLVARALSGAAPHGDRPVAVLEGLGGAGPRTTPVSVAGYHHRQCGLCVDELVAPHGVASAEGGVGAVRGAHDSAAVVHGPAHVGAL